jgi:hypothetical protein
MINRAIMHIQVLKAGSRDSSVGIATDYGLDDQEGCEFKSW